MTLYDRSAPDGFREIDRWEGGVGWIAHPDEVAQRASHAICGDDGGVWLIDPLDAPGVDDLIGAFGEVVGVATLFDWHARDADVFARRYGVPVFVPAWVDRVEGRIDAPVVRCADVLGTSGLSLVRCSPFPGWEEAFAYRETDGTLVIPESLATANPYTVGNERLGVEVSQRLFPPRRQLGDLEPERILVGHGEGVFEGATVALEDALSGARWRFPRALLSNGPTQLRSLVAALRE